MDDKDAQITTLKHVITETLWMARRYADKRLTFAPSTVNEAVDLCLKMGLAIEPDSDDKIGMYARDGMYGNWDPRLQRFEKE